MQPSTPDDPTPPTRPADGVATLPASAPSATLPVVAGYVVQRLLGRGGMGEVWLAEHATLHRTVALKLLRSDFTRDPAFGERFLREARAAARVNHPGVIGVHDAGRSGDGFYLAMDYMPGGDLRTRLANGHGLPQVEAVRLIADVADALQAIHDAGLVHRDLKPENILLDADGRPRIADLGLARSEQGDDRMTATGLAMGTPAYMSPEQARGAADIDVRSDVYALGATLFALLTGRPPFTGATPWVVVAKVMNEPAPDVCSLTPGISTALSAVVHRALDKDRSRRHPSAAGFAAEVRAALESPARMVPEAMPRSATAGSVTWTWSRRLVRDPRSWITVAVVVLVGGWVLLVSSSDAPPEAQPVSTTSAAGPGAPSGKPTGRQVAAASAPTSTPPEGSSTARADERNPLHAIRDGFRDVRSAVRGSVRESVASPLTRTTTAVRKAYARRGLTLVRDQSDSTSATLETDFSDGEDLTVVLRAEGAGTAIEILVGKFGDETRARQVLAWIHTELE